MSTQSMPQIPPRPSRSHEKPAAAADIPKIPPRPTNRRLVRSPSPGRASFAPSPLNDPRNGYNKPTGLSPAAEGLAIPRPPSVNHLPSVGQEGQEYGEIFSEGSELGSPPEQTRNVAEDLTLHAPKPSLPTSSAKQRVSAVTRTDSGQVAALGLGKAPAHQDDAPKPSSSSQYSSSDRPASALDSARGIPEIGLQVPMYPNAGDVQAPSPAPTHSQFTPGIGFHNDGSKPRAHHRKNSSRGLSNPPGSYGLHGHGVTPANPLEKAYYEKHPELVAKEAGHSPALGEQRQFAMSSEDLNRIVRDTASRGLGTSNYVSTPDEQIGFQASEQYASRISTPHNAQKKSSSSSHLPESPLKRTSFAAEASNEAASTEAAEHPSETAVESDAEGDAEGDDKVIHVEPPHHSRPQSRVSRSAAESAEDLQRFNPQESHDEYTAPILAADEVEKEPFGYELQPAISPVAERHYGGETVHYRTTSSISANNSRPDSMHTSSPFINVSTPLEDLEEYEPLFPEDSKEAKGAKAAQKPTTTVDRFKRPDSRKFPSRDIWEDTPTSLQYTATVSSEQLPEETDSPTTLEPEGADSPAHAFARKQEQLAEAESRAQPPRDLQHISASSWAGRSSAASEEKRSKSAQNRFPSKDVWEDTPDSHQLQATVSTPQLDEPDEPEDEKPTVAKPEIPARPPKAKPEVSPERSRPAVPERPKPQVPARPAKSVAKEAPEGAAAAAAAKPKPQVPTRPLGSKIAALQGGFLSDLNKRLQLGPQAPKKEEAPIPETEEPKEKAPLTDARKGRARGPARRAPAKSAAPVDATSSATEPKAPISFSFSAPISVWQISPDEGDLSLTSQQAAISERTEPTTTSAVSKSTEEQKELSSEASSHDTSVIEAAKETKPAEATTVHAPEASSATEASAIEANLDTVQPELENRAQETTSEGTAALVQPEPGNQDKEELSHSAENVKPAPSHTEEKSDEPKLVDAAEPGSEIKQAVEAVAEDEQH